MLTGTSTSAKGKSGSKLSPHRVPPEAEDIPFHLRNARSTGPATTSGTCERCGTDLARQANGSSVAVRKWKPVVNVDSWWDWLVRDRFQAVLELVLDAIAEDYVTVEIILKNINEWDGNATRASWAARSAAPVSRPEIIHALQELTREGYAQACIFNGDEARVVRFRPDQLAGVWFCATQKGINAIRKFLGELNRRMGKGGRRG